MSIVERALLKHRASGEMDSSAQNTTDAASRGAPAVQSLGADQLDVSHRAFIASGAAIAWDESALEAAGLLAAPDFRRLHQNQYRGVRRLLVDRTRSNAADMGVRSRAIAVTSALAGEGKTFTSFNLAISLAQDPEFQVLLIDGDLPRRSLTKALRAEDARGLSEYLIAECLDVTQLAAPLTRRLSFLAAGREYGEAGNRLMTSVFPQMLNALLESYPSLLLVIDAGPLLLSPGADVIAARAGAALVVVRAGVTPRSAVRDAIERIPKDIPTGVLLNAWEPSGFADKESYYGEYYE